jgi:Ran GTPase-activating protein (RanGAP) involved in mRNA processing and transport
MKAQDAERLAEVLAQCPALVHLDLSGKYNFGSAGAERLAGVLAQCTALAHLDFHYNGIGAGGAESLEECWRSAQRWLTSISRAIASAQAG